jgi:acyl carrier protein
MDSLAILRDFLAERLAVAPERVQPAAALEDLGVDSLMLLELLFEFEDRLGIQLSKDTQTPKTVGELLRLVETLRAARA